MHNGFAPQSVVVVICVPVHFPIDYLPSIRIMISNRFQVIMICGGEVKLILLVLIHKKIVYWGASSYDFDESQLS